MGRPLIETILKIEALVLLPIINNLDLVGRVARLARGISEPGLTAANAIKCSYWPFHEPDEHQQ
jgi:hypothetical protein